MALSKTTLCISLYPKGCVLYTVMLSVVMLNVIMLSAVTLSVVGPILGPKIKDVVN
jgi:hypothetical protein